MHLHAFGKCCHRYHINTAHHLVVMNSYYSGFLTILWAIQKRKTYRIPLCNYLLTMNKRVQQIIFIPHIFYEILLANVSLCMCGLKIIC
jgi:hypothetical protein